jgi:hypothetical protein
MGQTINKPKHLIKAYIHPVPGSSGCSLKKKNVVSIYTDHQILTLKTTNDMTGNQLKTLVKLKTNSDYSLFLNNQEIRYSLTLSQLGINEKSLIQARPACLELEKSFCKSTAPSHRRNNSTNVPCRINLDSDLSVYAAPEVGQLKRRANHHRRGSNMGTRTNHG